MFLYSSIFLQWRSNCPCCLCRAWNNNIRPFLNSRNIAIDYQWFPHWKCTINMAIANWICLAKWRKLVGKWPVADCYFELCLWGTFFKDVSQSHQQLKVCWLQLKGKTLQGWEKQVCIATSKSLVQKGIVKIASIPTLTWNNLKEVGTF